MAQATAAASAPPAAPPVTPQMKIPKQPECNIGSSGHVDHGKCLTPDQYVVIGGKLTTGSDLLESLESKGVLLARVDGGSLYSLVGSSEVISIGRELLPTKAQSLLFIQQYNGPVYTITTNSGRSITVTPEHPLLANRQGVLSWIKAHELHVGDYIAFLSTVPRFAEPSFSDPLPLLSKTYRTVTFSEFQHLRDVSNEFATYVALNEKELGQIRMLAKISMRRLSVLVRMDQTELRRILDGTTKPSAPQLSKIEAALSGLPLEILRPGEFMVETRRRGGWSCSKLRDVPVTEDLMKWLAFVWAEGTSTSGRLAVSQTVQAEMLSEFLEITRGEFGKDFKKMNDVDYHLYSKPVLDFLTAKYDFRVGNESVSSVPEWILGLQPSLSSTFLRWFFTLDGEFNARSGQIMISQANEKNIIVFGYLLQSFGIVPRFSQTKRETQKGPKTYARLIVSGRRNLKLFAELIGFEDPRITSKLDSYLSKIEQASKETDFSLPVNPVQVERLLAMCGVLRERFPVPSIPNAKDSDWYKAYSTSRRTGRLSRTKLIALLDACEAGVHVIEGSLSELDSSPEKLKQQAILVSLSLDKAACEIGISGKVLATSLHTNRGHHLKSLEKVVRTHTAERLSEARRLLEQFKLLASSPLEFDRIRTSVTEPYDGPIFDLTVPGYANFVAGCGAIVAHNTSLVQSITGVWASAHSEELKRGITIKVGYADTAFYKCPETPAPACYSTSPVCPVCGRETQLLRAVSFVDTPGHESLMTNMLAGAALMDGAVLVIAANEPVPRPQTREHLLALQMLGMSRIVIAQNKIDLVDDAGAKANYDSIKDFVANTIAADAPIVPISAQQRINIDALIEALEEEIPTPERDPHASPLMQVLRSFDVNRPGTDISSIVGGVLGGSLVRGELKVDDEIEILPGLADERSGKYVPLITKVGSLGTGAGMAQRVGPGGLIALGTNLDPTVTKGDQMVGSVIGRPGTLPPVWSHIKVELQLFESAVGSAQPVRVEKVKPGEVLRVNIGTASTLSTVTSARESIAEMDLKRPVSAEAGSRVAVSRRIAERWRLIGSGVTK